MTWLTRYDLPRSRIHSEREAKARDRVRSHPRIAPALRPKQLSRRAQFTMEMSAAGGRSPACKGDHAGRLGTRALQCSWQQRIKQRRRRARTWHGKRRRCAQQEGRQRTYRYGRSRGYSLPQAAQAAPRPAEEMAQECACSVLTATCRQPCSCRARDPAPPAHPDATTVMGTGPAAPLPRPAAALLGRCIACNVSHKFVTSAGAGSRSRGQCRRAGEGVRGGPRHWADAGTSRALNEHGGGAWLGLHGPWRKEIFTQVTNL